MFLIGTLSTRFFLQFLHLQDLNTLIKVLSYLTVLDLLYLLPTFRTVISISFFELKKFLVIFAYLFSHHYFLTFAFVAYLFEYLLSRIQEYFFEILHIILLSMLHVSYLFKGFGLNSILFFLIYNLFSKFGASFKATVDFVLVSSRMLLYKAEWMLLYC